MVAVAVIGLAVVEIVFSSEAMVVIVVEQYNRMRLLVPIEPVKTENAFWSQEEVKLMVVGTTATVQEVAPIAA